MAEEGGGRVLSMEALAYIVAIIGVVFFVIAIVLGYGFGL